MSNIQQSSNIPRFLITGSGSGKLCVSIPVFKQWWHDNCDRNYRFSIPLEHLRGSPGLSLPTLFPASPWGPGGPCKPGVPGRPYNIEPHEIQNSQASSNRGRRREYLPFILLGQNCSTFHKDILSPNFPPSVKGIWERVILTAGPAGPGAPSISIP